MTVPEAFAIAVQHHQSGRLPEAGAIYRQILAANSRHADALHLLGVIAHQVGRNDEAVDLIRQAIALAPGVSDYHDNLGVALQTPGQFDEAIASYRRACQIDPDSARVHCGLGNALWTVGQIDEAIVEARKAIQCAPDCVEAHNNLGYCDTMGMSTMDYRLTDTHADPPGTTEHLHTEQLVRLPDSAWCFRPSDHSPPAGSPPSARSGHITFGCFNARPKITGEALAMWSGWLAKVPGSRLRYSRRRMSRCGTARSSPRKRHGNSRRSPRQPWRTPFPASR